MGGLATGVMLPVAVLLLLGVVALASREPLRGGGAVRGAGGSPAVTVSPLALVLIAVGAAVALGALARHVGWPHKHVPEPFRTQPPFKASLALRIATLLVPLLIAGVLVVGGLAGSHRLTASPPAAPGATNSPPASSPHRMLRPTSSFELAAWVPVSVIPLVLAGTVVVIVGRIRRREDQARPEAGPLATIASAIDLSVEDVASDPDPRRAVIAAYRRMETSIAGAGLPRRPGEAPREYMNRASAVLELDRRPLQMLTTLFERARFSLRTIDADLRGQAITALRGLQRELE